MKAVILEDPSNVRPIGMIVEGVNLIRHAQSAKCATLPYVGENPMLACSGMVMQHYGKGWSFTSNKGERGCPLSFRLTQNSGRYIYWAARIGVDDPTKGGLMAGTTMRMVHSAERDQRGLAVGLNQLVHMDRMPPLDKDTGTAVVYGKSEVVQADNMFLFLELYVVASNLSVKWFGVSQHTEDLAWPLR
jgi:hypothetical protein